ncbi:MAG: DUF5071 domain-containing protein [Acidobacteria bacterium]|nr:DUF5071 domain-containing protein [Acidobacteriota bacterium]
MTTTALHLLLPRDKFDIASAERAVSAGYPAVAPILGELLIWLQDCNWPVAFVLAPFLATIGSPLVPHVRAILRSDDDVWKYWVLERIVAANDEVCAGLRPELKRIVQSPTPGEVYDEVFLQASEILKCWERRFNGNSPLCPGPEGDSDPAVR